MYSRVEQGKLHTFTMTLLLNILRTITLLFWCAVLSTFVLPWPQPFDQIVPILGGCILLVHGLEAVLFRQRLLQIGNYTSRDAVLILVFGVFHVADRYLQAGKNH